MLLALTCIGCSTEKQDTEFATAKDPNFRVQEFTKSNFNNRASYDEPCMTTNLIAGQHHVAGIVSVDSDGVNLIIKYNVSKDWTIEATHMSIGDCNSQDIPTTGSGNPKIGHFEYSTDHSTGVTEVVYYIDLSVLDNEYCFAAHAVVSGPDGEETAWAEGTDFEGNSWAMYVEALLSDCDIDEQEEEQEEEEQEEDPDGEVK